MERTMDKETFIKAFTKFLKRRNAFGRFISEEFGQELSNLKYNWVISPSKIDGKMGDEYMPYAIGNAFVWNKSKDGFDYYNRLSKEWDRRYEQILQYKGTLDKNFEHPKIKEPLISRFMSWLNNMANGGK